MPKDLRESRMSRIDFTLHYNKYPVCVVGRRERERARGETTKNTHKAIVGIKYASHINVVEAVGYQKNEPFRMMAQNGHESKEKVEKTNEQIDVLVWNISSYAN